MRRGLVVVADDFGLSAGVNEGVERAVTEGIVTAASLMIRQPAAAQAIDIAASHPNLDLGLHIDLGEWRFDGQAWSAVYQWVDDRDPAAVSTEVADQISSFIAIVGRPPTHLDSHQHVHQREPARTVIADWARRLDVPLRHGESIRYEGRFYGQTTDGSPITDAISVDALVALLHDLPAGLSELCCHPAAQADLDTAYGVERLAELETLCHPDVRAALVEAGIDHLRFRDIVRNRT